MDRPAAEILADYDLGRDTPDRRVVLHEILHDVGESWLMAMEHAGVDQTTISIVSNTVHDYIANHYGDD